MELLIFIMVNLAIASSYGSACKHNFADQTKILLYPYGHCMNSHLLVMERLGTTLAEKNHSIHMIINSEYHNFRPTIETDDISDVTLIEFQAPENFTTVCDYDTIDFSLYSPLQDRFNLFIDTSAAFCEVMLKDNELLKKLKAENYDLFIVEAIDPCGRILADFLDVPFIPLITTGLGHWDGNPRPPSYIPAPISSFTPDMTFMERLSNFIIKLIYESVPIVMGFDAKFEALKLKYGINVTLSIANTFQRASVKLVNSDFTFEYAAPVEPDTVLVGGFAIKPARRLPARLLDFVEASEPAGTIVFSMGTVVKNFGNKWLEMFMEAFSRLPQHVVWRMDTSLVPEGFSVPPNVLLLDWLPQADLLAHRSVRLFITHCGLNSAMEAAYFGKPVIAMPMFADQFSQSTKLIKQAEMGLEINLFTAKRETFHKALTSVLDNPKYTYNAKRMSARFADQLNSPIERALFWIEYVVRHGGAFHLKSHAHRLNWFQYFSLDVLFVALLCVLLLVKCASVITFSVIKSLLRILSFK